jgi:hypothetical protein
MKLDDSKAGKIGRCLQCNQKFRVPKDDVEEAGPEIVKGCEAPPPRDLLSEVPVIPKRSKQAEPPPPTCDADLMSRSGYELEGIGSPARPDTKHPWVESIDEDDEWEDVEEIGSLSVARRNRESDRDDDSEPMRHRPLKKRPPLTGPQKQDIITGLAIAGIVWIALTVISIWVPYAVYALLLVGGLIAVVGRHMFLHVARQEGTGVWLACLLVPFYSTYYFFTRLRETYKAFLIGCCGYVFVITGIVMYFAVILGYWTSPDVAIEQPPQVSFLRLQVDGENLRLAIDNFNYFSVKRGRNEFPDTFQLEGKGVGIFGKFWIGFDEQWDELLDKPLEVTSEDPNKREGDSHLTLLAKGDLKILRGKLVVRRVMENPAGGDPYLKGDIELELKGPKPRETLNIKGSFEAQVRTLH